MGGGGGDAGVDGSAVACSTDATSDVHHCGDCTTDCGACGRIIIEGVTGAGKSSVVAELRKMYGASHEFVDEERTLGEFMSEELNDVTLAPTKKLLEATARGSRRDRVDA